MKRDFSSAMGEIAAKQGVLLAHASLFNGLWHFPWELPTQPGAQRQ